MATCGTALGEGHFDLLRRFADRVVLAFDSDVAGSGAALKGGMLETPVRLDLDLRVAEMPDGMDPADLVQAGRAPELAKAIESSRPMLQFRLEKEVASFDFTEPESRARAVHRVAPLIARVSDDVARSEYTRFASRLIGVEPQTLEKAMARTGRIASPRVPAGAEEGPSRIDEELMRVVLANPTELDGIEIGPELFTTEVFRAAMAVLNQRRLSTPAGTPLSLEGIEDSGTLSRLALDMRPLGNPLEVVERARSKAIESEIDELEKRLAQMDPRSEGHSELLRRLIALQGARRLRET